MSFFNFFSDIAPGKTKLGLEYQYFLVWEMVYFKILFTFIVITLFIVLRVEHQRQSKKTEVVSLNIQHTVSM